MWLRIAQNDVKNEPGYPGNAILQESLSGDQQDCSPSIRVKLIFRILSGCGYTLQLAAALGAVELSDSTHICTSATDHCLLQMRLAHYG